MLSFSKLRDYDLYRKIPKDLTETTIHGSILSICAIIFMLSLFVAELWAFLTLQTVTNVVIDPNTDTLLRINFNITVMDMPCEFAMVDVVDVLGTRYENVTKNVNKWQVDENGVRRNYEGRNVEQQHIEHDIHHDIEELHGNGIHAEAIDEATFDSYIKSHRMVFVNFYAPWCYWCQRLEPVWEAFAERVARDETPASIVKVDCVANRDLCMNQHIQAFPSLRIFLDGVVQPPDYRSDRTVDAFNEFLMERISHDEQLKNMHPHEREIHQKLFEERNKKEHPGCMMQGFLLVNRVPGNFHIEARSILHSLNPVMANLSHIVNHLSFGMPLSKGASRALEEVSEEYFSLKSTEPMNNNVYVNDKLHQAYHHHMKVVSTNLELSRKYSGKDAILAYQLVQSSQVMQYGEEDVPEARFAYDLSPMSVHITKKGKHWYEFVSSICAIIGGTFTVVGLLSSFLNVIFKPKKI